MNEINVSNIQLPYDIRAKLSELQLELSEGDITQKGYEKKRAKLLDNYYASNKAKDFDSSLKEHDVVNGNASSPNVIPGLLVPAPDKTGTAPTLDPRLEDIQGIISQMEHMNRNGINNGLGRDDARGSSSSSNSFDAIPPNKDHSSGNGGCHLTGQLGPQDSPTTTAADRRKAKRLTRNESRYTSDIRQEAVQAALSKNRTKLPTVPVPQKRKSYFSNGQPVTTVSQNASNHPIRKTQASTVMDTYVKNIDSSSTDYENDEDEEESSSLTTPLTSNSGGDGTGTFNRKERNYYKYINQNTREKNGRECSVPNIPGKLIWPESPHKNSDPPSVGPDLIPRTKPTIGSGTGPKESFPNRVVTNRSTPKDAVPNYYFASNDTVPHEASTKSPDSTGIRLSPYRVGHIAAAANRIFQSRPSPVGQQLTRSTMSPENATDREVISKYTNQTPPLVSLFSSTPSDPNLINSNLSSRTNSTAPFTPFYANSTHASSFRDKSSSRNDSLSDSSSPSGRISSKIQQLLNTLKRPKKRPLGDFFKDEDTELENFLTNDPNAPKPEGMTITPVIGDALLVQTGKPRSLEAALQRYGTSIPKSPALMVLDCNGKPYLSLTYGKLLSRAYKISYSLLNKWRARGDVTLKPGDRVALVYPNTDPVSFACAFYGCLLSGIVPVPVDVPVSRRDAGYRQIGFLLGTCNVSLALTCDTCLKALPKVFGHHGNHPSHPPAHHSSSTPPVSSNGRPPVGGTIDEDEDYSAVHNPSAAGSNAPGLQNGGAVVDVSSPRNGVHVTGSRGWPALTWYSTEHLTSNRPPKDWKPPPPVISGALPIPNSLAAACSPNLLRSPTTTHTDNDKISTAYVEYSTSIDGSVKGVMVYKSSMLNHCKALTMACNYGEGEIMICVLDFKREVGLWHGILTSIYNGMHVIYVPYSLMKVNPSIWMHMITKFKATVAIVKSRDLHWGLLAQRDHRDINLSSLNLLLIADGSNPWSLSSCDAFVQTFKSKGLRPEVMCTSACSSEALTISLQRPNTNLPSTISHDQMLDCIDVDKLSTGRGVLSMSALSYGLIRLDKESSLTSLMLQNVGETLPGSVMVVVEIEGDPMLCRTDQIGEICVASNATGNGYWGLKGLTNSIFKVQPLDENGHPISDKIFVRTGLFGFIAPGGMVYTCSCREGLMTVSRRRHNVDDLIATVLAVQPMKFIYRGRLAIFSIKVLKDERIVIIAEQRPDCSEEDSFLWMSRVLQAIDSIHQVGVYCLALLPPNQLPKTPLGGIHISETKRRFEEGSLHPANLLMCPHACVTNLPKPRERPPEVSPASQYVGNMVKGERFALAHGSSNMSLLEKEENSKQHRFISETLKWRASTTPDHIIYTLLSSKAALTITMTCQQLHKRAEKIAFLLGEKLKIQPEDHVALIYPPGLDLISAFFGCLYINLIPVPIRPPGTSNLLTTISTVRLIVEVSKAKIILTSSYLNKLLKSKEACNVVDPKSWPITIETDDLPKKKPSWTSEDFLTAYAKAKPDTAPDHKHLPESHTGEFPKDESTAYLDFSVSTTGTLVGVKVSHISLTSLCRSQKMACELYPSRLVALCLDPYSGLGLNLWCFNSVYSGHHSLLIPPNELENHPFLWLSAINQYKIRDTFCSYAILELCTKILTSETNLLKVKSMDLSCLRNCIVVAEERPRVELTQMFSKLCTSLGLSPHSLSTTFGCRVNVALCLQGASNPSPSIVYADVRSLRNDRVTLVEKGSPYSVSLMESGKLLPGVGVVIANPQTRCLCADSHLGEIWVGSRHNSSGYYAIYGQQPQQIRGDSEVHNIQQQQSQRYDQHQSPWTSESAGNGGGLTHYLTNLDFHSTLAVGDTKTRYARTGYFGFVRRTDLKQSDGEYHDALFVVGSLEETIILRGMRFHPIDIEHSILRSHKKAAECAVFTWTNNLLVAVIELRGAETEALDIIPSVTNAVLEEHHLITGIVVIVDPGSIPINSRGEKQRMHLRDSFLNDELDPIYVAYNM